MSVQLGIDFQADIVYHRIKNLFLILTI